MSTYNEVLSNLPEYVRRYPEMFVDAKKWLSQFWSDEATRGRLRERLSRLEQEERELEKENAATPGYDTRIHRLENQLRQAEEGHKIAPSTERESDIQRLQDKLRRLRRQRQEGLPPPGRPGEIQKLKVQLNVEEPVGDFQDLRDAMNAANKEEPPNPAKILLVVCRMTDLFNTWGMSGGDCSDEITSGRELAADYLLSSDTARKAVVQAWDAIVGEEEVLDGESYRILRELVESGTSLGREDVAFAASVTPATARRRIGKLKKRGFIRTPEGEKSEYAPTSKGRQYVRKAKMLQSRSTKLQ